MSKDIVHRLLELAKEASEEIERLRDRCNDLVDKERERIMEHEPIRYDMNDPIFSQDAYE